MSDCRVPMPVYAAPERQCVSCDWFALKPGSKHVGVCFVRWLPNAYVEGGKWCGAYGWVSQWKSCCNWTPRGSIKRYEPTPTVEPKDETPPTAKPPAICERCGELMDEEPRITIDGRNVALCKPCFRWAMDQFIGSKETK